MLAWSAEPKGLKKSVARRVEAIDTRRSAIIVLCKALLKFSDTMTRPYVLLRPINGCWCFCSLYLTEQSQSAEVDLGMQLGREYGSFAGFSSMTSN